MLYTLLALIYLNQLISVIIFEMRSRKVNKIINLKRKEIYPDCKIKNNSLKCKILRVSMIFISIILSPLYLLYKTNGYFDYIKSRSFVNSKNLTEDKAIR